MRSRRLAGSALVAALSLAGCLMGPAAGPPPVAAPPVDELRWKLLSEEDRSVGRVQRFRYRVEVSRMPSRAELERVSREVIRRAPPHHGVEIAFYRDGTNPDGAWTAGHAAWWPNGRPGDAIRFEVGDYGAHRLALKVGDSSPAAAPPVAESQGIPAELRRRIYQEVLVLEGQGMEHARSVATVAAQHGLSEAAVEEISWEGVSRGWPLP